MKTKIVLLFLMITSFCFAQVRDEINDFDKVTKTLTGYIQEIPVNYPDKIISVDNTSGSSTVYFCIKRNGVVDSVKTIPIAAGQERFFYGFTASSIWIKGASGTVDIYIFKGTGRAVQNAIKSSSNANYSDSLKKFVQNSDSLSKYATPKYVRDYAGDSAKIARTDQNESISGRWDFADRTNFSDTLGVGPASIHRVNAARIKIDKSVTLDSLTASYINLGGTTSVTSNSVNTTFVSLAVTGALNFQSRGQFQTPADGSFLTMNWAGNNFVKWELGAGNYTTGFYHGTVDTDITSVYLRSPNGTLFYITVNDAGVISASTTAP